MEYSSKEKVIYINGLLASIESLNEEKNSDGTTSISEYRSANFVLDGHHKLLAYQELKIYPPVLSITSLPDKIQNLNFDMNEVKNVIFSWQYEHLCKD